MKLLKGLLAAWPLALMGCTGGDDSTSPDSSSAEVRGVTDDEIVLGSYTDLSGPTAVWGVGATNGARMRFEQANDKGGVHGRQIRFVVEDTAYQLPKAIQSANKLINRDDIFAMVLAVLEARAGIALGGRDIYLNVAGGLRISEPAADLAAAAALISSLEGVAAPPGSVWFGEIGLTGEVRPVAHSDARLREAQKLGFETAVVPSARRPPGGGALRIETVGHVGEVAARLGAGVRAGRRAVR